MRWPWNRKKDKQEEDKLKEQLLASARQQSSSEQDDAPEAGEAPAGPDAGPNAVDMPQAETPPAQHHHPADRPVATSSEPAGQETRRVDIPSTHNSAAGQSTEPEGVSAGQVPVGLPAGRPAQAGQGLPGQPDSATAMPGYFAGVTYEAVEERVPGTGLTLYTGKRGKKAIALKGRAVPRRVRSSQRVVTHIGRDLTGHYSRRGQRLNLISAQVQERSVGRQVWDTILYVLRWLFFIKPKILIIERYIWVECWGNFLLGSMGFTFFMIITTVFELGEKIFQKNIPPFTIAKVLMLSAPAFLVLAIPVAVVFSSLMAMNRLNRDNELTAFSTNGISLYRVFIPFLSLGIFAGLMTWSIYEHVVPPNNKEYKEVLKVFWEAQVVDFIKPGIIIKAPESKYFYVDEIRKELVDGPEGEYWRSFMYDIRLYDYFAEKVGGRRFPRIFVASKAWIEGDFLVLSEVRLYNLDEDNGNTLVSATMPEIKIDIGTRTREYSIEPHPTELTAMELRSRIQMQQDRILSLPFPNPSMTYKLLRDSTEYYFKYSIPVACVAFAMVCVPLMIRGPRDERNLGLIMTFGVVMVYYIIFFVCRTLGARGFFLQQDITIFGTKLLSAGENLFPPMIAGWLAPSVFFAAAGVLFWRVRK